MKEYIRKLPQEIQELIYLARDIAVRRGVPAYLVGGFARDLILGVKNFDLDIVVEGDGIAFAEEFSRELRAKLIRHRRFGTATALAKPHLKVDFSTARKEFYPQPAHLPVVEGGSLRDDLFRRDFTINAMAISIADHSFGELVDFFEGKADLRRKKIRVMHKLSFIDDPTRILRAVRFEQRFDFRIEPETLRFLKAAVRQEMLEKVQPQRLRDDLILILKENMPVKELRRLDKLAGLSFLCPGLKGSGKMFGLLGAVEKEVVWFHGSHPQRRHLDAWLIYLMALLDQADAAVIKGICRRFAFKRGEEKRILDYKGMGRDFLLKLSREVLKPSEVYALLEPLSYEVMLLLKAKYKNRCLKKHIEDFLGVYNGMRIHLSGDDLRAAGIEPGPHYQKIFRKILIARLDGKVRTREDELSLLKKVYTKK
jgi:tRNA nucleotidyltransferase (CCA-adding enzyme)